MPKNQKAAVFDAHAFLEAMGRGRTASKSQPQDVIFSQGDRADSVYYVRSGKVKLSVTSANGKEAVIAVLGSGDFFGEGSLIAQPVRLATACAVAAHGLPRPARPLTKAGVGFPFFHHPSVESHGRRSAPFW